MPENTDNQTDFDEFGEIPELIPNDADEGYETEDIPIYPQELVIFPHEDMTLKITDSVTLQMFDEAKIEDNKVVGITYRRDGDEGLPPVGSIGVAVFVNEITKTTSTLHFAKISGVHRYEIEEYLPTDKPYPIARVNYFDDEKDENAERFKAKLVNDLRAILQQMIDESPTAKNRFNLDNIFSPDHAEMYSFKFWWWHKLQADVRLWLLGLRSTYQRLAVLIDALEKGLEHNRNKKRAKFN